MGTGRPKKKKITWLLECQEKQNARREEERGNESASSHEDLDESKQLEEFDKIINELQKSESYMLNKTEL